MKASKNERGYALFLVIFIVVLFGVLSTSLLTLTLTGAKRNAIREDVTKATELSEKGIQHITQHIYNELKGLLGSDGLPKDQFSYHLTNVLNKYSCDGGIKLVPLEESEERYSVCIDQIERDANVGEDELRRLVTFKSIGNANDRSKEIKTKISFGAQTVPDNLKYVIGTVEPTGQRRASDGNVYFHGGVEIYGDVKVGNNLFTVDYGPGLQGNSANWRYTTLPALYPSAGYDHANIVLGGGLYSFNPTSFNQRLTGNPNRTRTTVLSFYNDHLSWRYSNRYQTMNIADMFANKSNLPVLTEMDATINDVRIGENISQARNSLLPNEKLNNAETYRNINKSNSILFEPLSGWFGAKRPINFSGNNKFKEGKVVDRTSINFLGGNHSFDKMYVYGDVTIGNLTTRDDPRYYDAVSIGGFTENRGAQLYVDGDVTIQGANLTSNLMVYATGTVTIRYTTIQGKEFAPGREGSLIVFSKGKIGISNNSLFKHNPSVLKGYFYSEDTFEMFGVGSNIKIHGGISARRITLNAVRGNYANERDNWAYVNNPTSINSPSRLIIEYDTELIENFLQLNPPEEFIQELETPEIVERE